MLEPLGNGWFGRFSANDRAVATAEFCTDPEGRAFPTRSGLWAFHELDGGVGWVHLEEDRAADGSPTWLRFTYRPAVEKSRLKHAWAPPAAFVSCVTDHLKRLRSLTGEDLTRAGASAVGRMLELPAGRVDVDPTIDQARWRLRFSLGAGLAGVGMLGAAAIGLAPVVGPTLLVLGGAMGTLLGASGTVENLRLLRREDQRLPLPPISGLVAAGPCRRTLVANTVEQSGSLEDVHESAFGLRVWRMAWAGAYEVDLWTLFHASASQPMTMERPTLDDWRVLSSLLVATPRVTTGDTTHMRAAGWIPGEGGTFLLPVAQATELGPYREALHPTDSRTPYRT